MLRPLQAAIANSFVIVIAKDSPLLFILFTSGVMEQRRSHQCPVLTPHFTTRINASRGLRGPTTKANPHHKKKSGEANDGLEWRKNLYLQRRAKERQQVENNLGSNLQFLQTLGAKECMFEVQGVILGRLAKLENDLKGSVENPRVFPVNFDERVKEVEEALLMLRY